MRLNLEVEEQVVRALNVKNDQNAELRLPPMSFKDNFRRRR